MVPHARGACRRRATTPPPGLCATATRPGPPCPPSSTVEAYPRPRLSIPPAFSPRPPLIYSTVGGSSRAGPANGALGYLALFLYGSLAIFASAAVLLRYVRGAK